jgi:predicted nuclease with TOPRIM domain
MENKQNSSGNTGIGNFGNNTNTQFGDKEDYSTEIKKLKDDINELNKRIDDLKIEKYPYINILVAIFILTFFFFLFAVFLNKTYKFGLSDDSIVLTFVGVLTTFIVVSNYMQVKDIERKFEEKIKEVNSQSTNRDIEIAGSISNTMSEMIKMKDESKMLYENAINLNETQKIIFGEMKKLVTEISNLKN